jgi:hypothetical protein
MYCCISCSKELTKPGFDAGFGFKICQDCEDTGNQMAAFLEKGIELEYSDGTKKTIRS